MLSMHAYYKVYTRAYRSVHRLLTFHEHKGQFMHLAQIYAPFYAPSVYPFRIVSVFRG